MRAKLIYVVSCCSLALAFGIIATYLLASLEMDAYRQIYPVLNKCVGSAWIALIIVQIIGMPLILAQRRKWVATPWGVIFCHISGWLVIIIGILAYLVLPFPYPD